MEAEPNEWGNRATAKLKPDELNRIVWGGLVGAALFFCTGSLRRVKRETSELAVAFCSNNACEDALLTVTP